MLLPKAKRPYVHALYGFARYADDIVDNLDPSVAVADRAAEFGRWQDRFFAELDQGRSPEPIIAAVIDTIQRWGIETSYFTDFLTSMAMDLTVTEYADYPALAGYMWGSAAVIGLQMLPILGYDGARRDLARQSAADLGLAFQLTNFIRDVGEDLDRGRIYLPQDSLREAGVDRAQLLQARQLGRVDPAIRRLLELEIDRTRQLYHSAEPGIECLDRSSRDCMRTALVLYREILDRIERADYQIFGDRISVPRPRRAQVAAVGVLRAYKARR